MPQNEESFSEKRLLKTNSIIKFDDNLNKNVETVLKDQFYIRDTIIHYYYQVRVAFSKLGNTLLSSPTRLINKILNREDHSLDYECTREDALKFCAYIDLLLKSVENATVIV